MKLIDALPTTKYINALRHSTSDLFQKNKKNAINRVRQMYADPITSKKVSPGIWFGGGKDSLALSIVVALSGIEATHLSLDNGGDVYGHGQIFTEWRKFYKDKWGSLPKHKVYKTEKRYPYIIKDFLEWGKVYGYEDLNFWNWGQLSEAIIYEAIEKFDGEYMTDKNVLFLWGNRAGEGQERAFEISKKGIFQKISQDNALEMPYLRGLPIGDWKDIDVWALLIEQNCPISPIYSYNSIHQKKGNRAYPRTLWYCSPDVLCSQFYRWLAMYSPVQLTELCTLFPEIPERLNKSENILD